MITSAIPGGKLRSTAPSIQGHLNDPRIRSLRAALADEQPRLADRVGVSSAAVAVVLRPTPTDVDILLIERPTRDDDPWSGHMALPGGRQEEGEDDRQTAIRETEEEVGIDLVSNGALLGRLDDVSPARGGPQIAVAPFVFSVPADTVVVPNPLEVATALWIPLSHFLRPDCMAEHLHVLPQGGRLRFPAIRYDQHVIWGLTYRILMQFLQVARSADLSGDEV